MRDDDVGVTWYVQTRTKAAVEKEQEEGERERTRTRRKIGTSLSTTRKCSPHLSRKLVSRSGVSRRPTAMICELVADESGYDDE